MTKQKDFIARMCALTLMGGVLFFWWWVVLKNFPTSHHVVFSVPPQDASRAISPFQPEDCVNNDGSAVAILCNEVYFTIRSSSWFSHAQLVITYVPGNRQIHGVRISSDSSYSSALLVPLSDYELDGGQRQAVWSIDLREIHSPRLIRTVTLVSEGDPVGSLQLSEATLTLAW